MIDQIRESRERLGSRNRETKAITLEDLKQQNAQRLARDTENRRRRAIKKLSKQQQQLQQNPEAYGHRTPVRHYTSSHSVSSRTSSNGTHQSPSYHYAQEYQSQHKDAHKNHPRLQSPTSSSSHGYYKTPQKVAFSHGLTVQELKDMTRARLASESTKCTETTSYSSYDSFPSSLKIRRRTSHPSNRGEITSKPSNAPRFFQDLSCCSYHSIDVIDNASVSSFVSGISESHTHISDVSGRHRFMPTHVDLGRALSEDSSECSDYSTSFAPFEPTYKYSSPSGLRNLHEDRPLSADKGDLVAGFTAAQFFDTTLSESKMKSSTLSPSSGMSYNSHASYRESSAIVSASVHNTDQAGESCSIPQMRSPSRPGSGNGIIPNSVAESVLNASDFNNIDLNETFIPSSGPSGTVDHDYHPSTSNTDSCIDSQRDNVDMSQLVSKWSETLQLYDELQTESPPKNQNSSKHIYSHYDWK